MTLPANVIYSTDPNGTVMRNPFYTLDLQHPGHQIKKL
jgi:hypothetical protein